MVSRKAQTAITAGFGALLCTGFALGLLDPICSTSGCDIYHHYSFLGMSFYVWGAIMFGVVCLFSTLDFLFFSGRTIIYIISAFIVADIFFLLYMTFFWVCSSCLIVAAVIAALFYIANRPLKRWSTAILACWMLFFGHNVINAGVAQIDPWTISQTDSSEVSIYFSPTCSKCRDVLKTVIHNRDMKDVNLIPIAKSKHDMQKLLHLQQKLEEGRDLKNALKECCNGECGDTDCGLLEAVYMRLQLWKNQSVLANKGWNSVPVIESSSIMSARDTKSIDITEKTGCSAAGESSCGTKSAKNDLEVGF